VRLRPAALGALAASVALVALVAGWWPGSAGPVLTVDGAEAPAQLEAVAGAPVAVPLSDGSRLTLQPGARLEVLENSGREFTTALRRGRTRFDVRPGGPRRWKVECGPVAVEVVGTQFTVERGTGTVTVEVEHGVVLVRGEGVPDHVRRLTAGERLVLPVHPARPAEEAEAPVAPTVPLETGERAELPSGPEAPAPLMPPESLAAGESRPALSGQPRPRSPRTEVGPEDMSGATGLAARAVAPTAGGMPGASRPGASVSGALPGAPRPAHSVPHTAPAPMPAPSEPGATGESPPMGAHATRQPEPPPCGTGLGAAPCLQDTPAPAPTVGGAPPLEPWAEAAGRGDLSSAYALLGAAGVAREADRAEGLERLLLLSDVARAGDQAPLAARLLERAVREGGTDASAAMAAFQLGMLRLEVLNQPREAAEAFARVVRLGQPRALVEDALARQVQALARAGDREGARAAAALYEARFPQGRRLSDVRRQAAE
jgi:hypothetical protein